MIRIAIIGTSGSGKTTFAENLAKKQGQKSTDLDDLYWLPNWIERNPEDFKEKVFKILNGDSWIIAGNYASVRDQIWEKADTIIWLNFSFPVVFGRALKRSFSRAFSNEEICNGNRESIKKNFFSRESILLWVLQTYWERRKDYPKMLKELDKDKKVLIFNNPSAAKNWLLKI